MKKYDFNRGWTVQKEGSEKRIKVNLPHDAMIHEKRSKDALTAGACGYFEGGKYTYRKEWKAPAEYKGKKILMECEGIYMSASILVNGNVVMQWPYGYTNFYTDLSEHLNYGEINEIEIIADNSKTPNTRWYSGSGVYREVQLYVGGKEYIEPEGIRVTVLSESQVRVDVACTTEENTKVIVKLLDGEKVVASGEGKNGTYTVENAKLWDAENPNLYQCKVSLEKEGTVVDEAEVTFGMRVLTLGAGGCKVNGKEVLFRGACIHHDNGILGACSFRDAEYRKVRILKEAGFNAIRSAHNPVSKAMLDACDELGMYMMDESFDMWLIQKNPYDYGGKTFQKWWKKDIDAMISKDYNHPSVVMYSIGNEISDLGAKEGQELCKEMAEYVRNQDTTRPITLGINLLLASLVAKGKGMYGKDNDGEDKGTGSQGLDNMPTSTFFNILMNKMGGIIDRMSATKGADKVVENVSKYLDMPGYNYATSRYKKEQKLYPSRAFVGSETLPQFLYKNWKLVESIPNLTGDFMWTGWDYLGESGIGTIQYKDKKTKKPVEPGLIISGGAGIIDICGKKRPEVGWGKIIWGLQDTLTIGVEPVIHADDFASASMWRTTDAVESWSWAGCEGKKTSVIVYANADTVELICNGTSLGKKKVKQHAAKFKKVVYQPGKLEAVAYDASGNVIAKKTLETAKGATQIALHPEKMELAANGQDLCYLDIDLIGEDGITKASDDQKLTVKVEGAGELQAFGSARPCMAERFFCDTHTTFYGKALAVIRAGYEPGEIKVTVSGDGLEPKDLVIAVK